MTAIPTFGETLPGLLMECVVDPKHADRLLLHTWDGHRTSTAPTVEAGGRLYVPKKLDSGLAQSVRLAPPSVAFGSTGKLLSSMRDSWLKYARLQPEVADLLVACGVASWFSDLMTVALILYVLGPASAVTDLLRLLACFCRRPVLVGDIDAGGLATLPTGLGATFLINQRDLGRRVQRTLLNSTRRDFCVIRGKQRVDLYGARVFSADDFLESDLGLMCSISPAQTPLPILTEEQEQLMARGFQARLLRYRLLNYERVREQTIDTSAFVPELQEEARSWLAPIVEFPELTKSVSAEILRKSQDLAGSRFADPKTVVVETALFLCHKPDAKDFLVGELTQAANDLLKGRHEAIELSAKMVGLLLRDLGIPDKREAAGYRVALTEAVRKRIHQLAAGYRVASLDSGIRRCAHCPEQTSPRPP
jgi:hypothetical protein